MKKATAILATVATVILAVPGVADAHTFTSQATCSGLAWNAQNYSSQQTNTITVTIDGTVAYNDSSFGTTDQGSRNWSQTVDHSWRIVVDAPGLTFDFDHNGVQHACQSTTTTVSPTSTTTPELTTTTQPTTTSSPPTTSPPNSTSPTSSEPPATTAGGPTTVDQGTPPTSAATPETAQLPPTGIDRDDTLYLAFALIAIGTVCILIGRRRP